MTTLVSFSVTRLETERLVLRESRPADFDGYATHMSDTDLRKYSGGPLSRRDAWRLFLVGMGGWAVTQSGWWMIEERVTGSVVGTVGAFYREWNLDKGREADLEVGWSIYREAQNRKIAREAAAAALAWAIGHHDPARIVAHIDKDNLPSIAVGRALGLKPAGTTDFYGQPTELYVLERR
jgi:RimJ/RimL family protein N-acetyltransferase